MTNLMNASRSINSCNSLSLTCLLLTFILFQICGTIIVRQNILDEAGSLAAAEALSSLDGCGTIILRKDSEPPSSNAEERAFSLTDCKSLDGDVKQTSLDGCGITGVRSIRIRAKECQTTATQYRPFLVDLRWMDGSCLHTIISPQMRDDEGHSLRDLAGRLLLQREGAIDELYFRIKDRVTYPYYNIPFLEMSFSARNAAWIIALLMLGVLIILDSRITHDPSEIDKNEVDPWIVIDSREPLAHLVAGAWIFALGVAPYVSVFALIVVEMDIAGNETIYVWRRLIVYCLVLAYAFIGSGLSMRIVGALLRLRRYIGA